MSQPYFDVIANSLQKTTPDSVKMHKVENHFIMDIDYDVVVKSIIDDLDINGFSIIKKNDHV